MSRYIRKFGFNPVVNTTTTPEDIWDGGGTYSWPTTAGGMTIGSTSAADSSTGTGARTVFVEGCSTAYAALSELVTLGTTRVSLTQNYLRVFRAYVVDVGSGGVNAADVTVEQSTNVVAQISASRGQSLMAVYTALDTETNAPYWPPYWTGWYASIGRQNAASAEISLIMREPGKAERTRDIQSVHSQGNTDVQIERLFWTKLVPGTDVWVRVESVTQNGTAVSAGFGIAYRAPGGV